MKEQKFTCNPTIIQTICDCGGVFIIDRSASALTSDPPKMKHICDKYGKVEYFQSLYPIVFFEIGKPIEEESPSKVVK